MPKTWGLMDHATPLSAAEVGQRVTERREAAGLSRAALARHLGCNTKTLYRWEEGLVLPDTRYLAALSIVLGKSVQWFLTGAEAAA